jgi:hypothetical protein
MLRLIFTVTILLTGGIQLSAQPLPSIIKTQAIEMGRALVKNDLPGFQKYLHPDMLDQAGGSEKMKALYDSAQSIFKKVGGSIRKITYGNPGEIVKYHKELQTTLPQTLYISTSFADIEMESILVAISRDRGKQWYFIDSQLYSTSSIQQTLPALCPEMVIPPPSKPRMIPKEK